MVLPPTKMLTKKDKRKAKEKAQRAPTLGNFDHKPTIMTSLRPPIRGKKNMKKLSVAEKRQLRKKGKAEKKMEVKKLKKKNKRPIFLLPKVDEASVDTEQEAFEKTPPINFKVNTKTKCMDVQVTLHKCPFQHINLDPNPTHFVMDTLKWSKKYQVEMKYPDGITVDPREATATFEHGILKVALPIKELPRQAKQKQAKVSAAIRAAKNLRFVQARGGELVGMRKVAPKEKKRKRSEDEEPEPFEGKRTSKKKFMVSKDELSEMAAEAAQKQEESVAAKQQQMSEVEAYFKERRQAAMEKKGIKAKVKDRALDKVVEQEKAKVAKNDPARFLPPPLASGADVRSKSKKNVSFAATNQVVKFGGDADEGLKKKGKRGKNIEPVVEYKD